MQRLHNVGDGVAYRTIGSAGHLYFKARKLSARLAPCVLAALLNVLRGFPSLPLFGNTAVARRRWAVNDFGDP